MNEQTFLIIKMLYIMYVFTFSKFKVEAIMHWLVSG